MPTYIYTYEYNNVGGRGGGGRGGRGGRGGGGRGRGQYFTRNRKCT